MNKSSNVAPRAVEILVVQDIGALDEEESPAASACALGVELQRIGRPSLDDEERGLPRDPDLQGLL